MALPINEDQRALADSVAAFARRAEMIAETCSRLEALVTE